MKTAARVLAALLLGGAACRAAGPSFSATVAADGGGQFASVQAAIDAAPQTSGPDAPWTIHIRPGTYRERVYVQREKRFLRLLGDDPGSTTIVFGLYASMPGPDGKSIGTFQTPTAWVDADDFTMEAITVSNDAGNKGQALALRVDGDRAVFRACRFLGWQDTILVNRGRQLFARCSISGAVDFIFGGATAFFESCEIHCLGNGYITAASTPDGQPFGLVFNSCRIDGSDPSVRTYLGRPWRPFASTVFVGTRMTDVVRPEGWNNWKKPEREKTARYSEFGSSGPGADPAARVPWATTEKVPPSGEFTSARVLAGLDRWTPSPEGSAQPPESGPEK